MSPLSFGTLAAALRAVVVHHHPEAPPAVVPVLCLCLLFPFPLGGEARHLHVVFSMN